MKIFSTVPMAALLVGVGAMVQSAPVRAELPVSTCFQLAKECGQGNQQACVIYDRGCRGEAPAGSILGGTSPNKSDKSLMQPR
ncbi:hypothetical protein [Dyella mobilis]|uniref:DUF3551 domain-containing protein n=1 Tax=Dyella mobilis TaxID=1849582 RepID=A0ABS2KB20_9GAMM|nr:hypothetical protein [Dyella mobilis]MBM7128370.1 hypothetical protein [Dyella mobilis]GLQ99674.1 hypothetical protein GCM10007863_40940 [Dyella mobilis]